MRAGAGAILAPLEDVPAFASPPRERDAGAGGRA